MQPLFTNDNVEYTEDDIYRALMEVGAADCETIFLHSDIMLGTPAKGFKRGEYVKAFYNAVARLGVKNLIVPTFTYSFCNNENYDVKNRPTCRLSEKLLTKTAILLQQPSTFIRLVPAFHCVKMNALKIT